MAFIEGKSNPNLGEMTGAGLASGIDQLLNIKMNQVLAGHERNRVAKAYAGLGLTPEQSQVVANVPEKYQMDVLRELAVRNQENQWRQQQMQQPQQQFQGNMSQGQPQQSGFQNFMGQIGQAQMLQQQGRIPFQSPQLAWQQQKFQQQMQQNQQKQQKMTQAQIDRRYAKFQDNIEKEAAIAEDIKFKAQQALQLIAGGGTSQRLGGYTPTALMNEQTAALEKIYNEIAFKKAQEGTGIMSRMKIVAAAATKPSLKQPIKTQIALLNDLINEQDRRGLGLSQITNEIIDANGGVVPEGLDRLVRKVYHQRFGSGLNPSLNNQNLSQGGRSQQGVPQANTSQPYNADDEDILSKGVRLGIGGASRVAAGLVSGPGDIVKMGANVADYAASKLGKNLGASEAVEKYSPLPTSEGIARKISEFTNGYTDPKSYAEDFGYRVLDTFGAFFMPQKAVGKVAQLLGKAGVSASKAQKAENIILPFSGYVGSKKKLLGQAAALHGVGDIASGLGADPVLKTALQTGAFLLAGTAGGRKSIENNAKAKFESSRKFFGKTNEAQESFADIKSFGPKEGKPPFQVANVKPAIEKLENLRQKYDVSNNINRAGQLEIIDGAIEGLKKSGDGTFAKMETLFDQTESLNRRFKLSTYARTPNEPYTPIETRGLLHDMLDIITEPIENIGKQAIDQETKNAVADYISAKESWKALNKYGEATQNLVQNTKDVGHGGTTAHFVWNLLKGGLSYTARDIAKVGTLLKSEVGRRTYLQAIDAASAGNITKAKQLINKLIAIAKKEGIE